MPQSPPQMLIATDQIQKYLEENKQLIMTILENQNLGKYAECAAYQAQLQQNLTFLARLADVQPQGVGIQGSIQQEHVIQPSQGAISQQPSHFTAKLPSKVG